MQWNYLEQTPVQQSSWIRFEPLCNRQKLKVSRRQWSIMESFRIISWTAIVLDQVWTFTLSSFKLILCLQKLLVVRRQWDVMELSQTISWTAIVLNQVRTFRFSPGHQVVRHQWDIMESSRIISWTAIVLDNVQTFTLSPGPPGCTAPMETPGNQSFWIRFVLLNFRQFLQVAGANEM